MAGKALSLGLERGLLRAGERVCVAVSGGADSVALLLGMAEANGGREALGVVLTAAHVNHGLRGAESDGDEAFVRELCARLGVPLTVFPVDMGERRAATGEGLEEAARELRYAALRGLEVDVVATAHTLDDQAETVVMKLLRGAWTEGLAGISVVVDSIAALNTGVLRSAQDDGEELKMVDREGRTSAKARVVRPFLRVRRSEVEGFLRARGQAWREDSSNKDLSLTRNRVRHELMPVLRGFNPGIDGLLANLAVIARDEEAHWEAEVGRILPQVVLPGKPVRGGGRAVGTAVGEAGAAVEIERLKAMDAATRRRVVRGMARSVGSRLSFDETAKLLALAGFGGYAGILGRIGSRLELREGLRAERSARELRIWRM